MTFLSRWHYPTTSTGRDLRLDLLRGYCVAVMTIDHVGLFPAWTIGLTGNAMLWVSAAEGFLLIAGLVMGLVYRRLLVERGWRWSIRKVARRAILLYAVGALGHLIFDSGDYLLRIIRQRPSDVPTDYFTLLQSTLFQTRYAPDGLSMMPFYALALLWGLGALYGLQRGKWRWVLLISGLTWYGARFDPSAFTIFRIYFNFPIWQLLFIIGLVIGYHRAELQRWGAKLPARRLLRVTLIVTTVMMLLVSYQVAYNGLGSDIAWVQPYGPFFDRVSLGVGRVLVSLWAFAGFYALLTLTWQALNRILGWLLLPLGQHALTAFIWHAVTTYIVIHLPGWPFPDHDPTLMGFIHLGIILAIWAATLTTVYVRTRWPLRRLSRSSVVAEA